MNLFFDDKQLSNIQCPVVSFMQLKLILLHVIAVIKDN